MTTYKGLTVIDDTITQAGDNTLDDLMVCCRGNQTLAAKLLSLNRGTLRSMLKLKILRDGVLYKPAAYAKKSDDLTLGRYFEDANK